MRSRVAVLGVFITAAMLCSYIESCIPISFGVPGMKLGLANLAVVILLYKSNSKDAYLVSTIRVILVGILFGNLASIWFGLVGCSLSLGVMSILKRTEAFSVYGVSVAGAVAHNIGQMLVALYVVASFPIGYYIPVLLVAGVGTGFVIGYISQEVLKRIQHIERI